MGWDTTSETIKTGYHQVDRFYGWTWDPGKRSSGVKWEGVLGRGVFSGEENRRSRQGTRKDWGALTCQLPGGQFADGSVLSPFSANTLDLTWGLWNPDLGPRKRQTFSIIIIIIYLIHQIITTMTMTASCPQYPFSPFSLVVGPLIFSWTHGIPE